MVDVDFRHPIVDHQAKAVLDGAIEVEFGGFDHGVDFIAKEHAAMLEVEGRGLVMLPRCAETDGEGLRLRRFFLHGRGEKEVAIGIIPVGDSLDVR